jgi:outer membrane protein OmpA-like peptidoglycan-associated protein
MKGKIILLAVSCFLVAVPCQAGWLDDTLRSVGEGLGNRAVQEAGDGANEGTKQGGTDAINSHDDNPQPQEASEEAGARDSSVVRKGFGQKATLASGTEKSGGSLPENDQVYAKYDFVPGDKVIFYDDFSETEVGEFPRKWHLKGPKGNNNNAVEVVEFQGKRFIRSQPATGDVPQDPSTQYLRLTQKGDLPEKFTIEFDAYFITQLGGGYDSYYHLYLLPEESSWPGLNGQAGEGVFYFSGSGGNSVNTKTGMNKNDNKFHHIAISVNGTFVKAYIDNVRVINDPDGLVRPIKLIGINMGVSGGLASDRVMIGNFRLAEGGKDVKSALDTDGKIITHGILFDTGKDLIKPESQPTLKMILGILNDNAELKFSIEGHTDSQGSKGINQPLSEKRAAAVKNWLVSKGIAPARLKTAGFGDTKPIDANKTPEGRANNRRVEFVKF